MGLNILVQVILDVSMVLAVILYVQYNTNISSFEVLELNILGQAVLDVSMVLTFILY